MGLKGRLSNKRILAAAEKSGLDMARLREDMKDPAIGAYIHETLELGQIYGCVTSHGALASVCHFNKI